MPTPVSVIFVRENPEQMTGSGCCGKLEGDSPFGRECDPFTLARQNRRDQGTLYRTLRQFFPPVDGHEQVQLTTVDPRNQPYLVPKLLHDVCCYRPGFWAGLKTLAQWFSVPAVIVNGRVVGRRDHPVDPDELCHLVTELLRRRLVPVSPKRPAQSA